MKTALLLDNMEVYKGRKRTWLFRGHLHVLPCHTPSITMVQIAMQDPLITICSIQNPLQVALTSKPKIKLREWWTLLSFLDYKKIVSVILFSKKILRYVVSINQSGITLMTIDSLSLSKHNFFKGSTRVVVHCNSKKIKNLRLIRIKNVFICKSTMFSITFSSWIYHRFWR